MGKHRLTTPRTARVPADAVARRARVAPQHWSRRARALPWVTMVLVGVVGVLAIVLLRPDTYAATAQVSSASDRIGQRAAVELTALDVLPRVEHELELDQERRGEVRLSVDRAPQQHLLVVTARARDPRLAALAADTAAALAISQFPDDLELTTAAPVPTQPEGRLSRWWAALVVGALAGAVIVERGQHRWEQQQFGRPGAAEVRT